MEILAYTTSSILCIASGVFPLSAHVLKLYEPNKESSSPRMSHNTRPKSTALFAGEMWAKILHGDFKYFTWWERSKDQTHTTYKIFKKLF